MEKPANSQNLHLLKLHQSSNKCSIHRKSCTQLYKNIIWAKFLHKLNKSGIPTSNFFKNRLRKLPLYTENRVIKLVHEKCTANQEYRKSSHRSCPYPHMNKHKHADKMTYCRPKRTQFKAKQSQKAIEDKLRLKKIVKRLAKARETEKSATIWRNYIQRLKLEHGVIKKYSREHHTLNIKLTQSILEEYYRSQFDPVQAIDFDSLSHDIHKSNSKLQSSQRILIDHNPKKIDTVFDNDADRRIQFFGSPHGNIRISICYPTSSQALFLKRTDSTIYKYNHRRNNFGYDNIDNNNSPNYAYIKQFLKTANEIKSDTPTLATQYKHTQKKSSKVQVYNPEKHQSLVFYGLVERVKTIEEAIDTNQKVTNYNQHVLDDMNEKLSYLVKVTLSLTRLKKYVEKKAQSSIDEQVELSQEMTLMKNEKTSDLSNLHKNITRSLEDILSLLKRNKEKAEKDLLADSSLKVLKYPEQVISDKSQMIFNSNDMIRITEDESHTNLTKAKGEMMLFNCDFERAPDTDNQGLGLYNSKNIHTNNKKSKHFPLEVCYARQELHSLPEEHENQFVNKTIENGVIDSKTKGKIKSGPSPSKNEAANLRKKSSPDGQTELIEKYFKSKQRYRSKNQNYEDRHGVFNGLNPPKPRVIPDYYSLLQSKISWFLHEGKQHNQNDKNINLNRTFTHD